MDRWFARSHPDGDGISSSDGWVYASGTSAAASQVSGIVALMIEKAGARWVDGSITPKIIKNFMMKSSIPVKIGFNGMNRRAAGHPNEAVGHGLASASAALALL